MLKFNTATVGSCGTSYFNINAFLQQYHNYEMISEKKYFLIIPMNGCPGILRELLNRLKVCKAPSNSLVIISSNYLRNTQEFETLVKENKNILWDNKNLVARSTLQIVIPTLITVNENVIINCHAISAMNFEGLQALFGWN